MDALFNSPLGLKNSKAIARQLIENGAPQDRFVLLEIRLGGLKYIAGPEPGGKNFLEHLKVQKKLFAVSVAAGRSYSRILGRVHRSSFKKIRQEKRGNETGVVVRVPIPDAMKDHSVDVFALRFDDKYQDVDVAWAQRLAKEWETVTLATGKNKKHLYFVIVEPSTASCIYHKIL